MAAEPARKRPDTSPSKPESEDDLAIERVHAAEALLPADAAASGLNTFFAALYRGAPPEDVLRYAPESLAALAELAFEKTQKRRAGETLIELLPFQAQTGSGARNETVFVGGNDDMPFLFDSLVAELGAQGVRIHALFHPIMAGKRDAKGARSNAGTPLRESVIVLALDSMSESHRARLVTGAA